MTLALALAFSPVLLCHSSMATLYPRLTSEGRVATLRTAVAVSEFVGTGAVLSLSPSPDGYHCATSVVDVVKGARALSDTIDFTIHGLPGYYDVGDTVVWFLSRCSDRSMFLCAATISNRVEHGLLRVTNPPGYSVRIGTFLDSLARFADATDPAVMTLAAPHVVAGTVDSMSAKAVYVSVPPSGLAHGAGKPLRIEYGRRPYCLSVSRSTAIVEGDSVLALVEEVSPGRFQLTDPVLSLFRVNCGRAELMIHGPCGEIAVSDLPLKDH